MSLIADGILILTCLTTAIYCYVLSRRLARLSNTDEGIGKQIAQLNAGLEETRNAVKEIRATTRAASEKLSQEVAHARKIATQLARLNEKASETVSAHRYQAQPAADKPVRAEPFVAAPMVDAAEVQDEPDSIDPVPEIVEDLAAPIELSELDEDAAAELDASEAAFASEGGQQLGFLPELDVHDDLDSDVDLSGPDPEHDDDLFAEDDLADLTESPESDKTQKGLLKVERMAL